MKNTERTEQTLHRKDDKFINNGDKPVNIRQKELTVDDLDDVARVHIEAFPDSAWTKLGTQVVKRYYHWQITGPHPQVLARTIYVDDDCAGFLVAGLFVASTSGFLSLNRFLLAQKVLLKPWLLFNPKFRQGFHSGYRLLKKYSPKKIEAKRNKAKKEEKKFGILAIAVSPKYQGYGIGKILMQTAEETAVSSDFKKMDLTVNPSNTQAIKFYERLNWRKVTVKNEWLGTMEKDII